MLKRNFLLALTSACALRAVAQPINISNLSNSGNSPNLGNLAPNALKPYLEVTPYKADENVVRIFFSPNCIYSRKYLSFFKNLGSTLSAKTSKETLFTPTTNVVDGLNYATAFAAVGRFHPHYVQNFIDASMIAAQDKRVNVFSWGGIDIVGSAVGFGRSKQLPESLPLLVSKNRDILIRDVKQYQAAQRALRIIGTPSVAITGTYIISPEFTLGDADRFSELINAVVSMTL
jgi:thiol:disulfide interchange protein DsbA